MRTEYSTRRNELDWLRVIAFSILIFFHSAILFVPGGIPLIQNEQTSDLLSWLVSFTSEFRLHLLFLVSGFGMAFSIKSRSTQGMLTERRRRLLLPLIFGILFIVPPMVYWEKQFLGEYLGSFWQFYPDFFVGVYPSGNFS